MLRALPIALFFCVATNANATEDARSRDREVRNDPWVPGSGAWQMSLATGVPFLVMGELTLGVSDYGAVGLLAGTTPIVGGFGLRPRGAIPIVPGVRALLSAPVIFYPRRDNAAAWFLTRPSVEIEMLPTDGWRVALGGGVVAVATENAIFGPAKDPETPSSPYGNAGEVRRTDAWGTLNALSSIEISKRSSLIADATVVLSRSGLAGRDWIGGPPFILFLGVSTAL